MLLARGSWRSAGAPRLRPQLDTDGAINENFCIVCGLSRSGGIVRAPLPIPANRSPRGRLVIERRVPMRKHVQFLTVGCALLALALLPGAALTSVRAETATTLAVISGTVTDDAGRPLGGAVVALFEVALNGRELKSVKTEYDGKFTTSISAGVYKLRAAADGYRAALTRVSLDASEKMTFDFALKREDRLVDQRGDRDDYRWIGRSVPRHVLHLDANGYFNLDRDKYISRHSEERNDRPVYRLSPVVSRSHAVCGGELASGFGVRGPRFLWDEFCRCRKYSWR